MFSNILFLILVLLFLSQSPTENANWLFTPNQGFALGMGVYGALLIAIYLQAKLFRNPKKKSAMLTIVNMELLIFLICYQYLFGAQRFLNNLPVIENSETIAFLYAFSLYVFGLLAFHISSSNARSAIREMRFLIPFAIPFLLITMFFDLAKRYPHIDQISAFLATSEGSFVSFLMTIGLLVLIMIFFPFWIQKVWQCKDLTDKTLKERLENVCRKAKFKHAGFKTWTVLDHVLTAAIIGVVPRYRYVMFTKRLLEEMPPEQVEAILAHEIGHSYRRHLWIYPFVLLGMSVVIGLFSLAIEPTLFDWFEKATRAYPSYPWEFFFSAGIFVCYALIIVFYFRIVFGFFSRLFERQADLHVFALDIPPQHLIDALHYIGVATNTSFVPNWHHYGIHERIEFLKSASVNPKLINAHHRRVRLCVIAYILLLAILIVFFFFITQ